MRPLGPSSRPENSLPSAAKEGGGRCARVRERRKGDRTETLRSPSSYLTNEGGLKDITEGGQNSLSMSEIGVRAIWERRVKYERARAPS